MRRHEAGLNSPEKRVRASSMTPTSGAGEVDPDGHTVQRGWRPCGSSHYDSMAGGATLKGLPREDIPFPPPPAITFPTGTSKGRTHGNVAIEPVSTKRGRTP